jgi:hypothetical protein
MPTKSQIIEEIQRTATANGGSPLGMNRFEEQTGIRKTDWLGVHWARWGDAVREAGFEPNKLQSAFELDALLQRLAEFPKSLGRLPTPAEIKMKRRSDSSFPSNDVFVKFGGKAGWVTHLAEFCRSRVEFDLVRGMCEAYVPSKNAAVEAKDTNEATVIGYVYLLKHGSRREYKIGRTFNKVAPRR